MSSKKTLVAVVIAAMIGAMTMRSQSQEQQELQDLSKFMRRKLGHSQKVLEGVVVKDFDMIAKNAQAMGLLSLDASWQVIQTAEYFQRSTEFRRTASTLERMAREENLDGAGLSYIQLTTQCFDCHKYVRDVQEEKKERKER